MQDGYALDERGIHHRVLAAVVETPPGRDCFGVLDVYPDRLELLGQDRMASAVMPFPGVTAVEQAAEAAAALGR
jgi:manganese-dependent ADP-ribose/CDP-alcohol diphosphatase